MDTRLLKIFSAVARRGSLVEASRELHLTPSALSHSLKALEGDVGCRLFDRAGKRMLLNQAGEHLLASIQEPLAALDAAAASLKNLGQWGQSHLRLGAAVSSCRQIVPAVVRELKKSFPKLILRIESGDMAEMVDLIAQNKIDLALGVRPEDAADLDMRPMFEDELLFAFASTHPWAAGLPITRDELRRQPLILYQRHSFTSRLVDDYFRRLDIVPSTVMEIASIEAIKELVKLNLGVSVLAPWVADRELARGTLKMRPLGPKILRRRWVIAHRAGRRLSLAEETFCRLCRNHTAGLRLDRKDLPA